MSTYRIALLLSILVSVPCLDASSADAGHPHANRFKRKMPASMPTKSPRFLRFLYANRLGGLLHRCLVSNKHASVAASFFADSRASRFFIKPFVKKNHINLDDYIVPAGGFRSFNQFFYRARKPELLAIDADPNSITSPADSALLVVENVQRDTSFIVKDHAFDLARLVGSAELAQRFYGGTLMVFRLAPADYHRFHFPLTGTPCKRELIPGRYESVNPLVYQCGIQPLTENERHVIKLETERCGTVLCIPVGALLVGKIVETYSPQTVYHKGDQMGYFAFGASSVVLLFAPQTIELTSVARAACTGQEQRVRMGQPIAYGILEQQNRTRNF